MSMCSSAVHVMYYFSIASGENFSNQFTELHSAIGSCVLLLQPFIAVCLFTSDMFDSWYSAACLLCSPTGLNHMIDVWLMWANIEDYIQICITHQKLLKRGWLGLLRTN